MKSTKYKAIASDIFSSLFIVLFIYAAISKLIDYQLFRVQIGKSPILAPFSDWIGWLIISLEIAIALALCVKRLQLKAFYAAFVMMAMFTTYIVIILNFSEYIPCSCGGILENMTWGQHLIFNIFFVCMGGCAVLLYPIELRSIAIEKGKPKTLKRVGSNYKTKIL